MPFPYLIGVLSEAFDDEDKEQSNIYKNKEI